MRGIGAQLWERRIVPFLVAIGMRPQDICAMRWSWVLDVNGFKTHIHGGLAVKDLAGRLVLGQPKTGVRDLFLFPWVAGFLDRLYEAQGRPPLDALVIPNGNGKFMNWGNWRDQVWYPALYRAGLANAAVPRAEGAFDPYLLRHIGATTMLHAARHDSEPGGYSGKEVARQFGHSASTLYRVYADVIEEAKGVTGHTMDEILSNAWREAWGPMPGEEGYEHVLLTTREAADLTARYASEVGAPFRAVSVSALGARIARGHLPATERNGRYLISEWDLAWHGLIPPRLNGGGSPAR
jgi:integrase